MRARAPGGGCPCGLFEAGPALANQVVKTRPGICQRKRRYASREEAEQVALRADVTMRAYKCALCKQFHLTSRTKGLRVPRTV